MNIFFLRTEPSSTTVFDSSFSLYVKKRMQFANSSTKEWNANVISLLSGMNSEDWGQCIVTLRTTREFIFGICVSFCANEIISEVAADNTTFIFMASSTLKHTRWRGLDLMNSCYNVRFAFECDSKQCDSWKSNNREKSFHVLGQMRKQFHQRPIWCFIQWK